MQRDDSFSSMDSIVAVGVCFEVTCLTHVGSSVVVFPGVSNDVVPVCMPILVPVPVPVPVLCSCQSTARFVVAEPTARSANDKLAKPGPKNSTNLSTTPR